DPAERVARANTLLVTHADALLAALRNSKNEPVAGHLSARMLMALCVHLDRPEAVRVFEELFTILSDRDMDRYSAALYQEMGKKAFARLEEADIRRILGHHLAVGGLQRVILDALGEGKHFTFRNTWDYLDRTTSHENPAGAPSARLNN